MARHYHVDIAVFAADADQKWVDNLLSHFDVPGVDVTRQGVARRISSTGIYQIVLIRRLFQVGLPIGTAAALAAKLLADEAHAVELARAVAVELDYDRFRREVDHRVAEGVESIVPRRRGRPPSRQD